MNIQDAIDVIESVAGFTDETTPVGEAWLEVLSYVNRRTAPTPQPEPPTDQELALRELGDAYDKERIDDTTFDTIKRALETLPNDRPIPAPQSGLPWPVPPATDESLAPQPTSAVQAIVKAFDDRYELLGPLEDDWQEQCLAAAIRVIADRVVPAALPWDRATFSPFEGQIRAELLAIAAEMKD